MSGGAVAGATAVIWQVSIDTRMPMGKAMAHMARVFAGARVYRT
jgi:hypothetical protein